jgi:hypothetical protein
MIPELSEKAWAILGIFYLAGRGGLRGPDGFGQAFRELRAHGLLEANTITKKGEASVREKSRIQDKSLPPRGVR